MTVKNFEEAVNLVTILKTRPTDDEMLQIYALYKQATVGDNENDRPGMLDFKNRAKHDTWMEKKGMSVKSAKIEYIVLVNCMIDKYGLN